MLERPDLRAAPYRRPRHRVGRHSDVELGSVSHMAEIGGDQQVQSEVLEGLATAVNHRRWFVELALPYLGDDPIEIGSGLGDYALEWSHHLTKFTATEADPDRLVLLKERMAQEAPRIDVREMLLPTLDTG